MSTGKKIKNSTANFKEELLDEIDDFLVDENLSAQEIKGQRQKALAELDKLIKQDLSFSQILRTIKKDTKDTLKTTQKIKKISPPVEYTKAANVYTSEHVVDLRGSQQKPKKKFQLPKFGKHSKKEKVETNFIEPELYIPPKESKPKKSINLKIPKLPKLPKLSLGLAFSKSFLFAIIVALILLPIRGLVFFGKIQDHKNLAIQYGQQGLLSLQAGVLSASENSYDDAQGEFDKALTNFNDAQGVLDEYEQWILDTAEVMPMVGKPISLSRNMLAVATNISEAASILNESLKSDARLTEHIDFLHIQINKTIPYLDQANADIQKISTNALPDEFRIYFDNLKASLPELTQNLHSVNDMFEVLLQMLGNDAERRYLVLFQNNNELRATGGFIGSFSLIDIYKGEILDIETLKGGLYDLEAGQKYKTIGPKPLSLINPHFNIWDANWWADYPTSAKKIETLYEQAGGSSVNGVISINAEVLKNLLETLGPVSMPEYGITITSLNLFDVLQEEVEFNYKNEDEPKAIIADLVPVVLDKLFNSKEKQKDILAVFISSLMDKDIQIYSNDVDMEKKIDSFGWSGRMVANDRDYLSVINTNIAGGKTDLDVFQTIDHQANIQENGEVINTVRITRTNKGDSNNPLAGFEGGNVSYMRIYVPLNSELIEAIGFDKMPSYLFKSPEANAKLDPDISKEENKMIDGESGTEIFTSLDKTVFANWVALKPGETQTVLLKYKLPFTLKSKDPLINDWASKIFRHDLELDNYSLVVQSQSGDKNTILNSSVIVPDSLKVLWNNATEEDQISVTDHLVTFSVNLFSDQYYGFIISSK
ncbi:DUF4012 domain-containing protein [Candidatus Parcubacteria bacterium]|jgi:tetratricopeptide (TPR) repeat protein|nr:DUF4012 domain-containing protein [Candidatus Parcubacteria bacterium]MBT7228403.1 DUF4012 domain-containing protein [Candidatus Parcubacteria bacterium]